MNKHLTQSLKFFLLLVLALSSACGPVTAVPSPTLTPAPSQTPTATATPSPTDTPEPIHPKGIIFYSDRNTLYSIDLESQQSKAVLHFPDPNFSLLIVNDSIYLTAFSDKTKQNEIIKTNLDGTEQQQLTTGGARQINSIDPTNHYLTFFNEDMSLLILDLSDNTSKVIAERTKNIVESISFTSWSTDGKKLIYNRILNPAIDNICTPFIYDITTKSSTELAFVGDGCSANWSPDGKSILFSTQQEGQISNTDIYQQLQLGILNLEKGDISFVSVGLYTYLKGSWSRNDKQLLMALIDEQKQTYLYVFNWEDNSINLISKIGYLQWPIYYSWSPNSDMVLYEQGEPSLSDKKYLYLIDIAKKTTTNLSTIQRGIEVHGRITEYWWWYHPTWSPDGRYFSYLTMSSNETDYEQNFILNIQSISSEGSMQIQIPRKDFIDRMLWINVDE